MTNNAFAVASYKFKPEDKLLLDINGLVEEYSAGDSDFNDQVISALCKRNGFKLVTDDGDFCGQDIPVVTANRHLLA